MVSKAQIMERAQAARPLLCARTGREPDQVAQDPTRLPAAASEPDCRRRSHPDCRATAVSTTIARYPLIGAGTWVETLRRLDARGPATALRLWREKRGEVEPERLSNNLIVELG